MKKGRPGVLLSVLCPIEREDAIARTLLRETSTLGMRVREVRRHEAEREVIEFESSLGPVAVKVKRLPGEAPVVSPEYEDVRAHRARSAVCRWRRCSGSWQAEARKQTGP